MSRTDIMLPPVFRRLAALLILLVAAAMPLAASAQAVGQLGSQVIGEQQNVIDQLTLKTDGLEEQITANAENDAELVEIRLQLEDIGRQLLTSGQAFRPRLTEINARLEQLGPPPAKDDTTEPEVVTQERQRWRPKRPRSTDCSG